MAELLTALTETEARLHIMDQVPNGGPFRFIRKWQYVDATYADDLVKAAPATVTNPYVDGQVHTGIYQVRREWGEGQQDRTVTVFQRLSIYPDNISFYSEQTGLSDDRTYLYKDTPSFVAAPVDSQGQTYKAENTINDDLTYDARLMASLSAEAQAYFKSKTNFFRDATAWVYKNQRTKIEAPPMTVAGTYELRQEINRDLTYDGVLTYEGPSGNGTAAFISEQAGLSDEHTTIYKEWPTKIQAPADSQGHIYQADNSITEMGAYNAQLRRIDSANVSFFKTTGDTYLTAEITTVDKNATTANESLPVSIGVVQEVQNQINKDLTYDTVKRQLTSKESEIHFRSGTSWVSTADTYAYQNMRTMFHTGLAGLPGVAFRAKEKMEADGTYTGDVIKITSVPQENVFYSDVNRLSTDKSHLYKGVTTFPDAGAYSTVQGWMYKASRNINEDGSLDGNLLYTVSFPQEAYAYWNTNFGLAWAYWMRNQATNRPDVYSLLSTNGSNSVDIGINPDLTYNLTIAHHPTQVSGIFVAGSCDYVIYQMQHREKPGSNYDTQQRKVQWHLYAKFFDTAADAGNYGQAAERYKMRVSYWRLCNLWRGIYTVVENWGTWDPP